MIVVQTTNEEWARGRGGGRRGDGVDGATVLGGLAPQLDLQNAALCRQRDLNHLTTAKRAAAMVGVGVGESGYTLVLRRRKFPRR